MSKSSIGVLPRQVLARILESGHVSGVDNKYINPASIDLPLSDEAYRLEYTFSPLPGQNVRSLIEGAGGLRFDLRNPLEYGVPYLIRVDGKIELPENVYGFANPKSSTGRINLLCRTIADGEPMYDSLKTPGWSGELWILARADSFPVLVSPGQAVSQVRLFNGKAFLNELDFNLEIKKHGLVFHPDGTKWESKEYQRHADSLLLTLLVDEGMNGWECRGSNRVFDYGKLDHYEPEEFFTPIAVRNGKISMKKGSFYILSTYERLVVPPHLSAELRAIDPRFGEFRSHSAGYFDPGWGWGESGEANGRPITLEITPYEDMVASNRRVIARVRYEHMMEVPDVSYDSAKSNYVGQVQGAALSKHFKKR